MSNIAKIAGQAANTLTKPLNVEDVFSTYLYEGNSSTQTITNGIDLAGEGGLVWVKNRDRSIDHGLYDTERGENRNLKSDQTAAENYNTAIGQTFNSDGFGFSNNYTDSNYSGENYASWTFRKAPKFFDIVTYTGDGTQNHSHVINHNLGTNIGFIAIKGLGNTFDWQCAHIDLATGQTLKLNQTNAASGGDGVRIIDENSFSVAYNAANQSGVTYVAYLFAHNDGDGEFGPDGDADIIKCGSYTGNGSSNGPEIDLGFEPQWLLIKRTDSTSPWTMWDVMRGLANNGTSDDRRLKADTSDAESNSPLGHPTATGLKVTGTNADYNASGGTYIYIAIRRGPMAVPESATDVFAIDEGDGVGAVSAYTSGFPVDFAIDRTATSSSPNYVATRLLQGTRLQTDGTNAEASESAYYFDYMEGWRKFARAAGNYSWMWKRAPGFFDVVAYTGNGAAGRTVSHNLGVAPEMMWVKVRDSSTWNWAVYAKPAGTGHLQLDNSQDVTTSDYFNYTHPTDTVFYVSDQARTNLSGGSLIAYLFASLAGVSKVGSYTGNGSSQNIDCGFSAGARLVLIKSTSTTGDWLIADTERGIVAGSDPYLKLNTTNAEVTSEDWLDPNSSGFIVNEVSGSNANTSGVNYIFYAVA